MEKPKKPRAQDKHDGDDPHGALSFDPATPPAAVDVHGFAQERVKLLRGLRGHCWGEECKR